MNATGRLPDFLIIGAQKAGTSALRQMLSAHPEIYLPGREIHYLDENWHRGSRWYAKKFVTDRRVCGEKTPIYIYHPECCRRMHQIMPDGQFVLTLRNPVDRAYSHYQMLVRRKMTLIGTFEEFVDDELERLMDEPITFRSAQHHSLRRGFYAEQLSRFLRYFNREQLCVVVQERLRSEARSEVSRVQRFLGVSDVVYADESERSKHSYKPMDRRVRDRLRALFASHNERLFELLGYRVSEWGTATKVVATVTRPPVVPLKSDTAPRPPLKSPALIDSLTIIIKTFERAALVRKLVDSIRVRYPKVPILIADDSEEPTPIRRVKNLQYFTLPFDCGLSAGRNFLLNQVRTDYFLLLDDDHLFRAETDLEHFIGIAKHGGLDVLGGVMINYPEEEIFPYHGRLVLEPHRQGSGNFFCIRHAPTQANDSHQRCSVVHNFFVARTSSVLSMGGWDPQLKIMEHNDFFLRCEKQELRVAHSNSVCIHHLSTRPSLRRSTVKYRFYRNARETYFRALFMRKYSIHELMNYSGKRFLYPRMTSALAAGEPKPS